MRDYKTAQSQRRIGALLRVPYMSVVDQIHANIQAAGIDDISYAHLNFFRHVDEQRGSRIVDLADDAQMTKQSMSYLVECLEARGYIQRADDPTDGRAKLIQLTERGHDVMQIARETTLEIEVEWADFLGSECMD